MAAPHLLLYIRKPFVHEEIQQTTLSLVGKWNAERDLAEEQRELVGRYRRLEALLDATGDAIALLDGAGRRVFANRAYKVIVSVRSAGTATPTPLAVADTVTSLSSASGLLEVADKLNRGVRRYRAAIDVDHDLA